MARQAHHKINSTPPPQARYWESVFFAGLFGFIALYPGIISDISYATENPTLFLLLSTASIALFLTLVFYNEFHAGRRSCYLAASAALAALAIISAGFSLFFTTPTLLVWFLDAALALFSFGYIIAKHLFRRIERDLRTHAPRIILRGLTITLIALLIAHTLIIFPIGLIALIIAGAVFLSALP